MTIKTTIPLIGAARVMRVHPRTIVRAIAGEHNTYWSEDINEDPVAIADIAKAYNLSIQEFVRVAEGRDAFLKQEEAARMLQIQPRTFRDWVKKHNIRKIESGKIVRYFKSEITSYQVALDLQER